MPETHLENGVEVAAGGSAGSRCQLAPDLCPAWEGVSRSGFRHTPVPAAETPG